MQETVKEFINRLFGHVLVHYERETWWISRARNQKKPHLVTVPNGMFDLLAVEDDVTSLEGRLYFQKFEVTRSNVPDNLGFNVHSHYRRDYQISIYNKDLPRK